MTPTAMPTPQLLHWPVEARSTGTGSRRKASCWCESGWRMPRTRTGSSPTDATASPRCDRQVERTGATRIQDRGHGRRRLPADQGDPGRGVARGPSPVGFHLHTGCGAAWLARLTGGQEVGSSNLPSPTSRPLSPAQRAHHAHHQKGRHPSRPHRPRPPPPPNLASLGTTPAWSGVQISPARRADPAYTKRVGTRRGLRAVAPTARCERHPSQRVATILRSVKNR